jgi:hypothetical protein
MSQAKLDVEMLMNEWTRIAVHMLEEYGEYHPYGAAIKQNGEIVSISAQTEDELGPATESIELLKYGFKQGVSSGEYKATALFYDVRIGTPNSEEKRDAIAVALDHIDNYSVVVFHPYELQNGNVVFGELTASQGANDIFGKYSH